MGAKAALPIGFVVVGLALLALDWTSDLGLTAIAVGCVLGGMVALAWRAGRHWQCE